MEDGAIIDLYFARNEDAIGETERKYGAFCRNIALNILQQREDAEECVNDTWHAAWNAMPPERPACLRAFLGRITRNLSISRWRRERAQKRYSGADVLLSELGECVPSGSDPAAALDEKLLTAAIAQWLGTLGADDRALFLRRYWYGDALKTLAAECGVGENRMAQRMRRLRAGLRRALEKGGFSL
jgi:RNA polymerase sigma-70 factor (ECF subfamily)